MADIGSQLLGGAIGIGTASEGHSESQSTNVSDSYGASGSSAYNYAKSWGDAYSDSYGWGYSRSDSESQSKNEDITYGREATAKDIELAAEQNALQKSLWNEAADYNAKQAQIDREFQAYMSNTAYQRAVKDLLAAGLNPILAVGNMGASTPVGAMGAMSSSNAYRANVTAQREGYGSSSSRSMSRSESKNGSHSESHSGSYAEGSSSSWSKNGSHSEGQSTSTSDWAPTAVNAIKDMVNVGSNAAKDIMNGNAGKVYDNTGKHTSAGNQGFSGGSKWDSGAEKALHKNKPSGHSGSHRTK